MILITVSRVWVDRMVATQAAAFLGYGATYYGLVNLHPVSNERFLELGLWLIAISDVARFLQSQEGFNVWKQFKQYLILQSDAVNRVVDKKIIIGKIDGRGGGGETQGVAKPPPLKTKLYLIFIFLLASQCKLDTKIIHRYCKKCFYL
jgi:hypothetical protein